MNKKTILSMVLGFASLLPASAQDEWFIEAGGGIQTTFSRDASMLDFGKRLTPLYTIGVGKWFNSLYAVRLQVGGYSLNGMSTSEGLYLRDPKTDGMIYGTYDPVINHVTVNPDGTYRHYLRYVNAHADVMFSLAHLLFHKDGKFDVLPAVGMGYARAFAYRGSASTNSLTANFSVAAKYRVLKSLDVNFEVSSALMPDHFDGRITGKTYEPTLGVSLGLSYRFGSKKAAKPANSSRCLKRCSKRSRKAVVDTVYMVEKIIERPVYQDRIVEKQVTKKQEPYRLGSLSFAFASANPRSDQKIVFANIADYLKNNPKARIRLDGYADKATGSERTNLMLSIRRTDKVRNILIEQYGIAPSRIEAQAVGCTAQPYDDNELNRVVIVYALP